VVMLIDLDQSMHSSQKCNQHQAKLKIAFILFL
jgi:hypothetical protein